MNGDAEQSVETDPGALSASEDLDEDQLQLDPLEKGVEPPEHWAAADRWGTTANERQAGEDLDARLAEEQPDVSLEEAARRPRIDEDPDEAIDDPDDPDGPYRLEEDPMDDPAIERRHASEVTRQGRAADVAGGSVADAIRQP